MPQRKARRRACPTKCFGYTADCHTERYGKMLLHCSPCNNQQSFFHACGHRSCHRCQHHDTVKWLERQTQKLLPVDYFMVTFSLPYQLRVLVWHHQKSLYSVLFDCAVSTLKQFGVNDKNLGSEVAMTARQCQNHVTSDTNTIEGFFAHFTKSKKACACLQTLW
ncbi:MAG TPA: hypothetical protein ENK04_01420 [Gammaproteobacteria bacterium]|nr:hypothetical protein [Gammaproteobacteria bacterium]